MAKRGNIVARRADTRNVSEDFQKADFLCPPQMLRAWQNESTFEKHYHVSDVAATMCPRFAGPLDWGEQNLRREGREVGYNSLLPQHLWPAQATTKFQ